MMTSKLLPFEVVELPRRVGRRLLKVAKGTATILAAGALAWLALAAHRLWVAMT